VLKLLFYVSNAIAFELLPKKDSFNNSNISLRSFEVCLEH